MWTWAGAGPTCRTELAPHLPAGRARAPLCAARQPWLGRGSWEFPQRLACSPLTPNLALRIALSLWGAISPSDNRMSRKGGITCRLARHRHVNPCPEQRVWRCHLPCAPSHTPQDSPESLSSRSDGMGTAGLTDADCLVSNGQYIRGSGS